MHSAKLIHVVGCHAAGEVGDVIVGGVADPPGATLWDKRTFIAQDQQLRQFILNEPRGGVYKHVNLLVPPVHPAADMGWIIMEPVYTPPMSGSNTMCVATVLLETGILPMQEPITRITLEAPAGLIEVEATCRHGRVEAVKLWNEPSFVARLDAPLHVAGIGDLQVDVAYGGDSFVLVDARAFGLSLVPDEADEIVPLGRRILAAANEQLGFAHPLNPDWAHISFCQFTLPLTRDEHGVHGRNTVMVQPGKLDRSPTGTGCSARLAVMHARGEIQAGEIYHATSVLGSRFEACIEQVTNVADTPAIVPSIKGSAWITGVHQFMLDPQDPWPQGYRLTDTWPRHADV